ncbi:hypothetical protein LP417_34715 (plasmid) [Polaromonas sp. P1-6]|nr:hypothetical protein LP417_34715 [Polaromonas sp. P1-6]
MAKPTLIRRNTDQAAMRDALGSTPASQTATTPPVLTTVTKDNHDAESYIVGQTYAVPLFKLQKSENNARYFYRADELDEMTTSLQKSGQDVPAIGYLKDGRVVLVDGQKGSMQLQVGAFRHSIFASLHHLNLPAMNISPRAGST